MDHVGALPYFTEVCGYNGPIYMSVSYIVLKVFDEMFDWLFFFCEGKGCLLWFVSFVVSHKGFVSINAWGLPKSDGG